jgi:hypothetical protein
MLNIDSNAGVATTSSTKPQPLNPFMFVLFRSENNFQLEICLSAGLRSRAAQLKVTLR